MFFLLFILMTTIFCFPNKKMCIDPKKSILIDLFKIWNNALQSNDPEKVVDLYSRNSVLLATLENEPLDTRQKKIHYFEEFLLKNPYGTLIKTYLNTNKNNPYISGTYDFNINVFNENCAPLKCGNISNMCTGNCRTDVKARFTYIYTCEKGEWKIQHHHSSKFPLIN